MSRAVVTLLCMLVSVAGASPFSVNIELDQDISDLIDAIKRTNARLSHCRSTQLTLLMAKRNGAWLKPDDDIAVALYTEEIPDKIDEIQSEQEIDECLNPSRRRALPPRNSGAR